MKKLECLNHDKGRNENNTRNGISICHTEAQAPSTSASDNAKSKDKMPKSMNLSSSKANDKCSNISKIDDVSDNCSNDVALMIMSKNGCEIEQLRQENTFDVQNEMQNLILHKKVNTMGPSSLSTSSSKNDTSKSKAIATTICTNMPKAPDDITSSTLNAKANKNTIQVECTERTTEDEDKATPNKQSNIESDNINALHDCFSPACIITHNNTNKNHQNFKFINNSNSEIEFDSDSQILIEQYQLNFEKIKTSNPIPFNCGNELSLFLPTQSAYILHKHVEKCSNYSNDEKLTECNTFSSLESCHTQHSSLDSGLMESCLKPARDISSKLQSIESRPIYPNVPYSPYGSPHANRRRPPLRESRRISIESRGSFLQLNQYKLMDQIGQGSYGLVKLAYSEEDSTHYAMKILSKRRLLRQAALMRRGPKKMATTSPLDRVYREIAVLKKLDHPNVVKLVEVLDDPVDDSLYLVFELVKQGEVLSIPTDKPLSKERAWSVFRDTLLGLEYLHYQRIIHADLKPGNLLLTECGHVKIADLGVCNEFLGDDATISNVSTASTPAFRAPETLQLGNHSYCGKASDIWALGATLYALVFGNVPFVANTIPVLYEKIKNDTLLFPEQIKISDELKDCIKCMLTKDPAQRITLPQLKIHTWVTMDGTQPLPSEEENCCLVQISEEDINSVVRSIPKLDTLILIKTMLKKHSFGNPFNKSGGVSGRAPQRGGSRLERFVRAGRSNSAPGAYNAAMDRQFSSENMLPSLSESGNPCTNTDE